MGEYHDLAKLVDKGDFEETDSGIIIGGMRARGVYHAYVDGVYVGSQTNKVPKEGLIYFLKTGLLGDAQNTSFYLALFSGAVNPQDNWTAANFASNASEIVDSSEGYSNASRPQWVPDSTTLAEPVVGNLDNLASYDIVCSSSINISGAAVLTSSTKGGTSGVLISATRFENVHTVNDGSTFQLGYEIELIDA